MGPVQTVGDDPAGQGVPADGDAGLRIREGLTLRGAPALLAAGLIAPAALQRIAATEAHYAVAISPAMRALILTPDDPIGRQFIPDPAELVTASFESPDPIGDDACRRSRAWCIATRIERC